MDRPKRPPPVPKFQDKSDKAVLQERVSSFMSSLQEINPSPLPQLPQLPQKKQVRQKPNEGKKKNLLASLNSKINNMFSAKKGNLASALKDSQNQKKEKEEKTKKAEADYDPLHPNNYEISKHQYFRTLEAQTDSDIQEEEVQESRIEELEAMNVEVEGVEVERVEQKEQTALRMMQKMGFRVGEGLGRQSQGIKTPLVVKKTNQSSGIIQQSQIPLNYLITPLISIRNALEAHNISIESVIVLTDIADLKQFEDGVQLQIRQECRLYGQVVDWLNYLWQDQVRIFIQFQNREQAFRAFVAMNGKYFGQRLVSVRFYSECAFGDKKLDKALHQHIAT